MREPTKEDYEAMSAETADSAAKIIIEKERVSRPPLKPTGMNVLIRVESGETMSHGGIHLVANSGRGRLVTAILVACGPGETTRKAFVKNPLLGHEGKRVVFDPYALKMVFSVDGARCEQSVSARAGDYAILDNDLVQALCDPDDRVQPGNA